MSKHTFLITGVAGLIGSNMAHWLITHTDSNVVGIDDLSGGAVSNLPDESDRFKFYQGDAASDILNHIFETHKPTHVYHFSCWAAEGASPFFRKHSFYTNNMVSANVVNNCINHDVTRLLFTSTMAVYGYGDNNPPFSEELIPAPIDTYGIGKYAVEMDIRVAGIQHGLDWCIIRPHNVYGKFQQYNDKFRNVLGIWMFQYLRGLPLTIFGDGEQKRSFSYIDDTLHCFYNAMMFSECSCEVINLGGIHEYSINDALSVVLEVFEADGNPFGFPQVVHCESRHEVKDAYPTYQKSVDMLKFNHVTDLRSGIQHMWNWVKDDYTAHNRCQLELGEFEVSKGVYEQWKVDKK